MIVSSVSTLSPLIRKCRRAAGLTQLELAQKAGVGKTVVFDIEKGKETVQFDTLLKLLKVLEIQLQAEPPAGVALDTLTPSSGRAETQLTQPRNGVA